MSLFTAVLFLKSYIDAPSYSNTRIIWFWYSLP